MATWPSSLVTTVHPFCASHFETAAVAGGDDEEVEANVSLVCVCVCVCVKRKREREKERT